MSPISADLGNSYKHLLIEDVRSQLPGNSVEEEQPLSRLTELELTRLISSASAMALSNDPSERMMAYGIITRLLNLYSSEYPVLIPLARETFSRLGNFPARSLLEKRYDNITHAELPPLLLELESYVRYQENTVTLADDYVASLTDFQYNLLSILNRTRTTSVSAPTSAGKSFVLGLYIQQVLRSQISSSIVYLVPTRALIRQVLLRIVNFLNKSQLSDIPVRSVPIPLTENEPAEKVVYVLTQERLLTLLFSDIGEVNITSLIVDEAQGVGDGARGIILQTVIDIVLQRFPEVDLHFASPLASNPEFLAGMFGRAGHSECLVERESPVTQNVIHVNSDRGYPRRPTFELQVDGERIHIDQREVDFNMTSGSVFARRAQLANDITKAEECTIIYANRPDDAEKTVAELVDLGTLPAAEDTDILEFIEFLREHIHSDYQLISALRYGCAFHYGFMPQIVRSRVEELFSAGKLKFICCTSTLLQGVNLPAKHIILENPRRGRGQPMDRPSFLNLAGRAGRLLQEFQGDVWCLNSNSWDQPEGQEEPSYAGEDLSEIKSAFGEVMVKGADVVRRILEGERIPDTQADLATTALGRIFVDYVRENRQAELIEAAPEDIKDQIREVIRLCEEIEVTLPRDVLRRNWTVNPNRLQDLYEMLSQRSDIDNLIPLAPWQSGSNRILQEVFHIVDRYLAGRDNNQYRFYSLLAFRWVHEEPLRKIIRDYITYQRKNGRFENAAKTIREIMEALETEIRYRYVKQVRAYLDILSHVLVEQGQQEAAETIAPLHLFLECGASSIAVLSLLSIGLTRTTSLLLRKQIGFPDDATPEQCRAIIRNTNIDDLDIPAMCRQELRTTIRGSIPTSSA
ncbi:MAG: DEAD/DEAH box helicase [candidate division Zixibacteria bacterium]|nr:DEAD/DEAH box helicase [candidate division Zixibacteria bacterium]